MNKMKRSLVSGTLVAILAADAVNGASPQPISPQRALTLVQAFLYQDFVTMEGRGFTASAFGDAKKNAASQLGVAGDPNLEAIRSAVQADFQAHSEEYWVRSNMAQARTVASGDRSHVNWQRTLWAIFTDDPRYVARILRAISGSVPVNPVPEPALPLTVSKGVVQRVAPELASSLKDRAKQTGCDSKPLTALPAVAKEDPLLVLTVFEYFTSHDPADRTIENALQALRTNGWTVTE